MTTLFGNKVRELRIKQGIGLREAARKAGIDAALWSKLETGSRRPPNPITMPKGAERRIRAIADVLKTPEYEPFFELMALATLPDDASNEVVQSLSTHYKRRLKGKREER